MMLFGLGLGFYGGIAATRRAMKGPVWVQRIFGISYTAPAPVTPQVAAQPPAPVTPPTTGTPSTSPANQSAPGPGASPDTSDVNPVPEVSNKPDKTQVPAKLDKGDKSAKKQTATSRDLEGFWTTTDTLPGESGAGSSMISTYVFNSDNTGEFDSNGRKLYDFRWKPEGDDLVIDFEGEGPDPNQPWSVKMKWSLNSDKSVLTLVPSNGKDPRNFVYSLSGPGVYRRKSQGPANP